MLDIAALPLIRAAPPPLVGVVGPAPANHGWAHRRIAVQLCGYNCQEPELVLPLNEGLHHTLHPELTELKRWVLDPPASDGCQSLTGEWWPAPGCKILKDDSFASICTIL